MSVDSVNKNLGVYLTDTFNVTPDLAVTASGRYNIAHVDLADQLGTNLNGYNRFVHFNPALGATYKVLPPHDPLRRLSQKHAHPDGERDRMLEPAHSVPLCPRISPAIRRICIR